MSSLSQEREKFPVVDTQRLEPFAEERLPLGEEGAVEKVQKEGFQLEKEVTDGQGRVIVTSPEAEPLRITLPVKERTFADPKNWHKGVTYALSWLLTFVKKIIAKHPGQTVFQE